MKIGSVVHGPNIIDSGYAIKIIDLLENFGEVYCRLGGTMGRTAVIDAYLEDKIDISTKRFPSESVELFLKEGMDVVFLLNYGKSSVTGHTFGYKVIKKVLSNVNNKSNDRYLNKTIIQIERPGEIDGSIISWNGKDEDLAMKLSEILDLKLLDSELIKNQYLERTLKGEKELKSFRTESNNKNNTNNNINIKNGNNKNNIQNIDNVDSSNIDDEKIRYIHGVSPNENIFVNGIAIGKSNSETVFLVSKNGIIVDIIGGNINNHGVEKLGLVDIQKTVVKTGLLRKSKPKPRIMNSNVKDNLIEDKEIKHNVTEKEISKKNHLKIAFVYHAAEDIYNLEDSDLVVTIGDDTTIIASDILYRFNIPVIGITDGDLDKVVESGYIADNSLIIELKSGFDDIVGKSIFEEIFNSKHYIYIGINDINNSNNTSKNEKIEDFKNEIIKIVNNITSEYIIKK